MSNTKKLPAYCQLHTIPQMSRGLVDLGPVPLKKKVKFLLKRNLDAKTKRRLKKFLNKLPFSFFSSSGQVEDKPLTRSEQKEGLADFQTDKKQPEGAFKAGDLVRIRSKEEIVATLDGWNEMKGCMFMPDMWQFCGTTQKIFKVVERFVDERDYRLKKGKGIVLLDGLICQGTEDYGRCDRSCFYFWRVEWLEKIEE